MRRNGVRGGVAAWAVASVVAWSGPAIAVPPEAPLPAATEMRRIPAAEAGQGAASDGEAVYAIDNRAIARIAIATGETLVRWEGDPVRFRHINSCILRGARLVCAASNYPDLPMESRVETFDARSLRHLDTRVIASADLGSLTWLDRHAGAWWACFANYDGKGGDPRRDHRATVLLRFDDAFRETGRWRFPDAALARFAPRSASGGAWGRDGLLYVTGHDRPELYAFRVPPRGDVLEMVATLKTPTGGQAIGWDPRARRLLWSIDRRTAALVASRVPALR